MSEQRKPKILIAAGGTGGHLFPAQALAEELLGKDAEIDLLFAGAGLASNRYFKKEAFAYQDISSGTLFRGNILVAIPRILSGIRKSLKLLKTFQPNVVIGFGSFHSFPLLVAACLRRVPFLLFESNAVPGKVNRLFSRWAQVTALHFAQAAHKLSGSTLEVAMPVGKRKENFRTDKARAREYFGLSPNRFTLLVFGGSQGSQAINQTFSEAAALLASLGVDFQVVHLTGPRNSADRVKGSYALSGVSVCVKEFEEQMPLAWKATDLVVCRCGAATLAELIACEVPAVLIPYPFAADAHQRKNAEVMQNEIKGARMLLESDLSVESLGKLLHELISDSRALEEMRQNLRRFKDKEQKNELSDLVYQILTDR